MIASEIKSAMLDKFPSSEWAVFFEVANGTGTQITRYADAIMMSLWPSRGQEIHGVEIKVSKSDWKREAKDPNKAEEIAQFCDKWWIHVAPGVIEDLSEVPPAWGVRVFDGKRWKTLREAKKTASKSISRGFLASILRASQKNIEFLGNKQVESLKNAINAKLTNEMETIQKRIQDGISAKTREYNDLVSSVKNFEEISGITINSGWKYDPNLGIVLNALIKSNLFSEYGGLIGFCTKLDNLSQQIKELNNIAKGQSL